MFSFALGLACFVAFWLGDERGSAWFSLALMGVLGLLILVGGRFELVRGLRGDGRDEYWGRIDLLATTFAGLVALTAIIAMCLWEWAHGRDGTPYAQLGALAAVSYVAALAVLRLRRVS